VNYAETRTALFFFKIFLNGRYTTAGVGASDGVGFGEFVMHQQFANHSHAEIQFCHSPDLTGFQWLQARRRVGLIFLMSHSAPEFSN